MYNLLVGIPFVSVGKCLLCVKLLIAPILKDKQGKFASSTWWKTKSKNKNYYLSFP